MSFAADTLLSILKTVAKVEENREQFHCLVERAAQIFLTITAELDGVQADERLLSNVKELERCVLYCSRRVLLTESLFTFRSFADILALVDKASRHNYIQQLLFAQKTTGQIQFIDKRLQDTMSIFQVQNLYALLSKVSHKLSSSSYSDSIPHFTTRSSYQE